jgi:predicted nuclease of predicted toxin-antitoxin system
VTFYLDENLSPRIAEMLRARGLDAVSAHEAPGNTQLDDRSQLLYAAGARRAMVTCDIADFAELTGEFIATNREHCGIVLVPSSFRTDEFVLIADAVEQVARDHPGGLAGMVVFLRRPPR